MALFKGKKEEKNEQSELYDIVLDMMIKDQPKEEIFQSLKESGLSEEEAQEIYDKVKDDYEEYIGSRLDKQVEKSFEKHKENIFERMDSKINELKKDMETKRDLRYSEQKEYTDNKFSDLKNDIENLENQFFDFRADMKSKIKSLSKESGKKSSKSPLLKALPVILILVGAVIIIYSILNLNTIPTLLEEEFSKALLNMVLQVVFIFTGMVLVKFGKDIQYSPEGEEIEETDQSWI